MSSITASGTTVTYKNASGTTLGTFSTQDTNTWNLANNLTTTASNYALDARQGKVLADRTASLVSTDKVEITVGILNQSSQSFGTPGRTGVWYMSNVGSGYPSDASKYGMLFQMRSPNSVHSSSSAAVYAQLYIDANGYAWTRCLIDNSWSAWRKLN